MDSVKIIYDGQEKVVDGVFYLYNSKYYLIYTEKELVENDYVVLYCVQVGKEVQNTPTGVTETGYMLGVEIADESEWKNVQQSIMKIVSDKKNNTQSPEINYLPSTMLSIIKVASKNKFRLMKTIITQNFGVKIEEISNKVEENQSQVEVAPQPVTPMEENQPQVEAAPQPVTPTEENQPQVEAAPQPVTPTEENQTGVSEIVPAQSQPVNNNNNVIINYRSSFFEEQIKNEKLQEEIDKLKAQLESIKKIVNE